MQANVLFIGSIGVVSETSDLQRQAYNEAFKSNGINWNWSPDLYRSLLQSSGGIARIERIAAAANQDISAEKVRNIHGQKTELACNRIIKDRVTPRPGIVDLVQKAKAAGAKVAWVTSTSRDNTNALLQASNGQLKAEDFDYIFHREDAAAGKPAPDVYETALRHFNVQPEQCVAIEDSLDSILAAKGAGIYTIATLGANHQNVPVKNIADASYASAADIPMNEIFV